MKINIWKKKTLTCADWFAACYFRDDEIRANLPKFFLTRTKVGLQKMYLDLFKHLLLQMILNLHRHF